VVRGVGHPAPGSPRTASRCRGPTIDNHADVRSCALTTYLDQLLAGAYRRVAEARARQPLSALRERARGVPVPSSLYDALAAAGVGVIAEVKRASPSKGPLAPELDAAAQARAYVDGGAAAISVLTEPDLFLGSLDDLAAVAKLGRPALRKDFIVDPYQVWEARLVGASAVLLIVAALEEATLQTLHEEAHAAGLSVLVEVHDDAEVEVARRIGARIVGVNARDLRTFELDRDAFARLRPRLPQGCLAVAESGVRDADDVRRAAQDGADAVLVGESVVVAEDPRRAVADLVAAGADAPARATVEAGAVQADRSEP
jgi:indole-3-glycerol phosphate synthase